MSASDAASPDEETVRRLVADSPSGVFVHVGGEIVYANERAARLLGADAPDELLGRSAFEFVPSEDRERADARLEQVQEDRDSLEAEEYRVTRLDGDSRWLEARSLPVEFDGGEAVQTVIQDIEGRKSAELTLRETEHRYQHFVERVQEPVYVTSRDGEFLDVNPAFVNTFGYSPDELRSMTARELYADPEQREEFRRRIEERGEVDGFEVRLRRADGRELIGELSTVAVDDGDRVCYEGIIRDVTEERQARAAWERRALHDDLTGLPNRTLFWDRLEHAIDRAERRGGRLGVLFVDVDGFKAINDRHGHTFGDRVLREVADRMAAVLRDEDTIARYGGDEFTVLLERIGQPADVERAVRRLRYAAAAVSGTPEGDDPVTISVGTTLFEPEPAGDPPPATEQARELVAEADRAMYEEKSPGERVSPDSTGVGAERDPGDGVPPAVDDPDRLAALHRSGLLEDAEDPTFDRITDLAAELLDAPVAFVSLVDEDRQVFKSSCGFPEPWASAGETPLDLSYCQHTVDRREPFAVEDARSHPIVRDSRAIDELDAIAYLGVPLITNTGHALGAFCVLDHRPRAWDEEDVERLRRLAAVIEGEIDIRLAAK